MQITTVSAAGAQFTAAHEGFASQAYLCPAGVITIGYGFTNSADNPAFAAYWQNKYGRPLRMGDTMSREEADVLLRKTLNGKYALAVVNNIGPLSAQYEFDSANDMAFNAGTGATKWRWAQALKAGQVAKAARLLLTTAITGGGRVLVGLKTRRQHEARLMQIGDYGDYEVATINAPSTSRSSEAVMEYQRWLAKAGYYNGDIDGIAGPNTRRAVREFQRKNGLVVDGIVGPATRATMIRVIDKHNQNGATGAGGAAGGVASAGGAGTDIASGNVPWEHVLLWGGIVVLAVVVVYGGFQLWRHRGAITGQRVPT